MRVAQWWVFPAVVMLGGCAATPAAFTAPGASAGSPEATQTVSATSSFAPPSATSFAPPSATPSGVNRTGELVAVVTADLVVRSRPGTGSDSEIYAARLSAPTVVYIIAGPEAADGHAWYLVDPLALPCRIGCDDAPRPGWVAAAGKDGERWLAEEPERPTCSDEPTLDGLLGGYPQMWLYCFGAQELTLNGVPSEEYEAPPGWPWGWPWGRAMNLYPSDFQGPVPGCVDVCTPPSLNLGFDGDGGVPSPYSATRVQGHFDDARAKECRSPFDDVDERVATHECRKVFVVTGWD